MNNDDLVNEILGMLHSVRDDRNKLEKLHRYIQDEIYEEPDDDEKILVPEKYRPLVKEIAEWLEAGMICYVNAETLELINIPATHYDYYVEGDEDPYQTDTDRIEREWKKTVTVEAPDSNTSFSWMERFASTCSDGNLKSQLTSALNGRKPFRNFNAIIHQSAQRDDWFAFKRKCFEEYTASELIGQLPGFGFSYP